MKNLYFSFCLFLFGIFVSTAQTFSTGRLSETQFELALSLPDYSSKVKTVQGQSYQDFSPMSRVLMMQKDAPALPMFSESIQVPDSGDFTIEVNYGSYLEYENVNVLPSKGSLKRNINPEAIPYVKGDSYNQDSFFPGDLAQLGKPYIYRKTRGITVTFYPFQYNPVSKKLRVYNSISVKIIHLPSQTGINQRTNSTPENDGVFASYYKNHYANAVQYENLNEQGELLIVCPTNFRSTIQPFANWKNEKGIKTTIVELTETGSSSTQIKSFIANYYSSNPNLVYVILVGDHEHLPTYSYGITSADEELYSDSFYGQLEGDDYYPELLVGRFSGNIATVQTIVNRTLEYEINPMVGTWMTNAIGIGSNEGYGYGDDEEADWQHLRNIKNKLQSFGYNTVHEFYEGSQGGGDSPGNPTSSMIVNAINQGVGLMNYTGHGWTEGVSTGDFTNSSVSQLSNGGSYPFVVSVACNNGTFVNNTSLCEALTAAKQGQTITGAIASCGSSILMAWAEPMQTQDEMTELIIQNNEDNIKTTLGGLFYNGQVSMLESYNQSYTAEEVMQTWVFFGDPTTVFRNQEAVTITAVHPEEISINGGVLNLVCNVDNATVTISQNNEIILNDFLVTNELNLNLSELSSDDVLKVTITKPNTYPYRGEIVVDDTLTVSEFEKGFVIYPNPTSDFIHIKNNTVNLEDVSLSLTDINGRILYNQNAVSLGSDFTIPVNGFSTGLYVLTIKSGNNQKNQKIMIK